MSKPIKLKIELKDMSHKIVRKVLVPDDITMYQLHLIIQDAMGWEHAHLFEFSDAKWKSTIRAGIPDDFDDDFDVFSAPKQDVFKTSLKKVFLEKTNAKPFWYWYDFGDDWWHRITFLKVSQKDLKTFEGAPICIEAIGKCPPEDCGGVWGYEEFLETIKDKSHPDHDEMKEWYGMDPEDEYDETTANFDKISFMLKDMYKSKQWKAKKPGFF